MQDLSWELPHLPTLKSLKSTQTSITSITAHTSTHIQFDWWLIWNWLFIENSYSWRIGMRIELSIKRSQEHLSVAVKIEIKACGGKWNCFTMSSFIWRLLQLWNKLWNNFIFHSYSEGEKHKAFFLIKKKKKISSLVSPQRRMKTQLFWTRQW